MLSTDMLQVETDQFRAKFREKRGIACGVCCQFFIVPFLGYVACTVFKLDAGAAYPTDMHDQNRRSRG
jgi:predicted Na+-dependent transporter